MYAGYKEEGDVCGVDGCNGHLKFEIVENCSCHISAPCTKCLNVNLYCPECGWTNENEPINRIINDNSGISIVEHKPRQLDKTKIDYTSKMHTASTMIREGVYPNGISRDEVEQKVRGTFGGRFEKFENGKFRYIAYTD